MKEHSTRWMTISGGTAIIFFLIANFTEIMTSLNLLAGCIQIAINIFVFITWTKAFFVSSGFKKFVAFFGVILPAIMAGITIFRVLL